MNAKIEELNNGIATLTAKVADAEKNQADMKTAMDAMSATQSQMETLRTEMDALQSAVPTAFAQAEENYLASLDAKAPELESTFQRTLNGGFANVFLTTAVAALLALLMLAFYISAVGGKAKTAAAFVK